MSEQSSRVPNERPLATVGIYAKNRAGEILFIQSPKWGGLYVVPSGHIEYGETVVEAAIREMKEETGLVTKNPRVFGHVDVIRPTQFHHPEKHFVGLEVMVDLDPEDQAVTLDPNEASDYVWLSPQDVATRDDVEPATKQTVIDHLLTGKPDCPNCRMAVGERDRYKEGWQRATADYQNLQKEIERKRSEWVTMSEAQVLEEFLPIYTNFKTAFAHKPTAAADKQWGNWAIGIGFIMKQFAEVLRTHGIEEMKTIGEFVDTAKHEIVGEEMSDAPAHTIVREVETGYTMKGRVLKVAKVIVAKSNQDV